MKKALPLVFKKLQHEEEYPCVGKFQTDISSELESAPRPLKMFLREEEILDEERKEDLKETEKMRRRRARKRRGSKQEVVVFEDSTSRGRLDPTAGYKGIQFEGKAIDINTITEDVPQDENPSFRYVIMEVEQSENGAPKQINVIPVGGFYVFRRPQKDSLSDEVDHLIQEKKANDKQKNLNFKDKYFKKQPVDVDTEGETAPAVERKKNADNGSDDDDFFIKKKGKSAGARNKAEEAIKQFLKNAEEGIETEYNSRTRTIEHVYQGDFEGGAADDEEQHIVEESAEVVKDEISNANYQYDSLDEEGDSSDDDDDDDDENETKVKTAGIGDLTAKRGEEAVKKDAIEVRKIVSVRQTAKGRPRPDEETSQGSKKARSEDPDEPAVFELREDHVRRFMESRGGAATSTDITGAFKIAYKNFDKETGEKKGKSKLLEIVKKITIVTVDAKVGRILKLK